MYGAPVPALDAEKLESLRRWGRGLREHPQAETAAAGRAILLLIEEIERLHALVEDEHLVLDPVAAEEARSRWSLAQVLHDRLRDSEDLPPPQQAPDEPLHR